MQQRQKRFCTVAFVAAEIWLIVLVGICIYYQNLKSNLIQASCAALTQQVSQQSRTFYGTLESEARLLMLLAQTLPYEDPSHEATLQALRYVTDKTNFEWVAVCDTQGAGLRSTGEFADFSTAAYLEPVLRGSVLWGSGVEYEGENRLVPLAVPVKSNNETQGMLVGMYSPDTLAAMISPSTRQETSVFLVDKDGRMLATAQAETGFLPKENFFDTLQQEKFSANEKDLANLIANIKENNEGFLSYKAGKETYYVFGTAVVQEADNLWYLFLHVPQKAMVESASKLTLRVVALTFFIAALFTLAMLHIWLQERRHEKTQKEHVRQLERLAYYDSLTGCHNLAQFKKELEEYLQGTVQEGDYVLKLDIANFKIINSLFHAQAGDTIIRAVAAALWEIMRQKQACISEFARISSDEFIVRGHWQQTDVPFETVFEAAFKQRVKSLLAIHRLEFRYGRCFLEQQGESAEALLEKVNLAHRMAKQEKAHKILDYSVLIQQKALRHAQIEDEMEAALKAEEFKLYLQPKYNLATGSVAGAEALVRWHRPNATVWMPDEFIPVFEQNGFIAMLDLYMMHKACLALHHWVMQGYQPVKISVNFSKQHIVQPRFTQDLCAVADSHKVPHNLIEIEVTESMLCENQTAVLKALQALHAEGFGLSLDDFGAGYSSLALLKSIPVDTLKLDKTFLLETEDDSRGATVVAGVLAMAQSMGLTTVAEGVETAQQVEMLTQLGCDMAQGYYYAKPLESKKFEAFLSPAALGVS